MKGKKIISVLLAVAISIATFVQIPLTASADNKTVRDTVLILDDSGSMEGEPMDKLMAAAEKFCQSVLSASGTNRVAIITYSTYAYMKCDFTDDMPVLTDAIHDMSEYGTTNIYDALGIANDLLENSSANIKNVVLMSDGLPNEGAEINDGQYDYNDYSRYSYANAVYDRAVSYHPSYNIYTLGFFHSLYGDMKAFAGRFMEDLQNAGYYEVESVNDLEFTFGEIAEDITETKVTGTFRYPCGARDCSATYYYADEYFYNSSFEYNPSLSTMSLCLALSAFGSGEVSSYENKSINVKNLMEELMFTDFKTTDSFKEKPSTDSIAAVIGQKRIRDKNDDVYTLLAVAVRGGGYEQEWASNFTIGNSGNHEGFSDAANQVIDFIRGYITEYGIEGDIKLWITGYSRAAATSNLVAGALDSGSELGSTVSLSPEDLYAYCFETPAGAVSANSNDKGIYGNIHNIVNPNDVVTKVAPAAMGFRRYGYDHVLPSKANKYNAYSEELQNMLEQYHKIESTGEYVLNNFVYKRVNIKNILPGGKKLVFDAEHQMSMDVFLDAAISELVYEYIDRQYYNSNIENGVRELCKALFADESKAEIIMSYVGNEILNNISGLLWKILWDENGAFEEVAGYLVSGVKAQGTSGFSDNDIIKAAKPLLSKVISYLVNHLDYFATFAYNFSYFKTAHYPDLCLAWMQSMDDNYTTDAGEAFSSGSYRIIRINCPVDVKVYDSDGNLVASIVDDDVQELEESLIVIINDDGEKVVYMPADAEFTIDMTGTDDGSVTYSVNEHSYESGRVNRVVNYYDVPIEKDRTLSAVVPAYDITYLTNGTANATDTQYRLTDMDGNVLTPDLDVAGDQVIDAHYTVTALSDDEKQGSATGSGTRQVGSFAKVVALPEEGYTFNGWYVNDIKISSDAEYRFCVREDVTVVAKFDAENSAPAETTPPPPPPENTKEDNDFTLIVGIAAGILLIAVVAFLAFVLSSRDKNDPLNDESISVDRSEERDRRLELETEDVDKPNGFIQVTNGPMNGFTVPINDGEMLYLGKDTKIANLVFTNDYPKVSRVHCTVTYDAKAKRYYVVDASTNGTYFTSKKQLTKGRRTAVEPNTILLLANKDCAILLG